MDHLETLLAIALDFSSAQDADDQYDRLLAAVHRVIPYDAAALLRLEGDMLVPLAARGLSADALGRRYPLDENPRLEIICRSDGPVRFPADSDLPDPFDGLLEEDPRARIGVHACLGCPLRVGDELVGALTADAVRSGRFDGIDSRFLAAVASLAGAAMRTANLLQALQRAAERSGRVARDLMREARLREGSELIGASRLMQRLREEIALVGRSDYSVLITGETGTGKELVARAVHAASLRHDEPLIYVNCAALPETLAESELFGHRRGAFTGAASDRAGKFEVADQGTLFLDEIGELPLTAQPKLLRALQEGEIQRVGSDRPLSVDVRVLAATNRNLQHEVQVGRFRADLFHRLNVYPLHVPPLRERDGDIPLLAGYFCDLARRRLGLGPVRLSPEAVEALARYDWPGNVRELDNVISRVALRTSAAVQRGAPVLIEPAHLDPDLPRLQRPAPSSDLHRDETSPTPRSLREATRDFQRALIRRALDDSGGKWAAAARALGMHRSNLHHLARRLGLK